MVALCGRLRCLARGPESPLSGLRHYRHPEEHAEGVTGYARSRPEVSRRTGAVPQEGRTLHLGLTRLGRIQSSRPSDHPHAALDYFIQNGITWGELRLSLRAVSVEDIFNHVLAQILPVSPKK